MWSQVKALFDAVRDLPPAEARAELRRLTDPQGEIAAEVESLLAAHWSATSFLEKPPAVEASERPPDPLIGSVIGPYRVVREISRGGMGVVYFASRADEQFHQNVAIKVLRAGTPDIADRFRTERRILAALDHPGIARLLDGGALPDGRPYFVMELVDGMPIDEYCRHTNPPLKERLRLVADLCAAVQYAHQHLVIHRDLKPSNVLVTTTGQAKLLDFGIAKLLDDSIEQAALTVDAYPMTPRYASPEQLRGKPVSTATDVYALGVLLFELLTGRGPYTVTSDVAAEWGRAILDQDPTAPSAAARARSAASGPGATGVAPVSARLLEGDLDTILLKALQKSPQRRYSSALALAEDIERHLDGRPVSAKPDTLWYRVGKFARRNRAAVGASAAALLLLVAAFGVTFWQYRVAARERALAQRRFSDVRQLANTFIFEVHDAIRDLPGSTAARARIVGTAVTYLDRLNQEAAQDDDLAREVAAAYERLAGVQGQGGSANLGDGASAVANQQKALALRATRAARRPTDAQARLEQAETESRLAGLMGDSKEAMAHAMHAVELVETTPTGAAPLRPSPTLAGIYYELASKRLGAGDINGAVTLFEKNIELLEAALQGTKDPGVAGVARNNLALTNKRLGAVLGMNDRVQDAFVRYRRALAIEEAALASNPNSASLRRAVSVSYSELGWLERRSGNLDVALANFEKAREIREALHRADPANRDMTWMLSGTLLRIGSLQAQRKQWTDARAWLERAAEMRETFSKQSASREGGLDGVVEVINELGHLEMQAGNPRTGAVHFRHGLDLLASATVQTSTRRTVRASLSASLGWAEQTLASTLPNPVRCMALDRARRAFDAAVTLWRELEASGSLFASDASRMAEVNKLLAAVGTERTSLASAGHCGGEAPDRDRGPTVLEEVASGIDESPDQPSALRRAVAYLAAEVPRWRREEGCYSCHNNGDAARALMRAGRAGFDVRGSLTDTLAFLAAPERWESGPRGPFEDRTLARVQFAFALSTAAETALVDAAALTAAARLVVAEQQPDGSWRLDQSGSLGSPATYGTPLVTWAARRVLIAAGAEFAPAAARATAFIQSVDSPAIVDLAAVALAVDDASEAEGRAAGSRARSRIVDAQSSHGGWGPFPAVKSEPFDTAIAVLALSSASASATERERDAARRGQAFLRGAQQSDGAWLETTRPAGQLSYAQRLSTAGWATLALLAGRVDDSVARVTVPAASGGSAALTAPAWEIDRSRRTDRLRTGDPRGCPRDPRESSR